MINYNYVAISLKYFSVKNHRPLIIGQSNYRKLCLALIDKSTLANLLRRHTKAKYPIPAKKPTTRVVPKTLGALFLATRNAVGRTAEINMLLTCPKTL